MIDRNDIQSFVDDSEEIDPRVVELAEDFGDRLRNGEDVSIGDYLERFPDSACQIKHVFPAIVAMEKFAGIPTGTNVNYESGQPHTRTNGNSPAYRTIGDYEIKRAIGCGGMGVVYLAEQPQLQRIVAIKILPPHFATNPKLVNRFRKEARAAARMNHPGIVQVFDVDHGAAITEDGGQCNLHYFAMQYIEGASLDKLISHAASYSKDAIVTETDSSFANPVYKSVHKNSRSPGNAQRPTFGTTSAITEVDRDTGLSSRFLADNLELDLSVTAASRWREIARIGMESADALSHAHSNEVLHRDIKPSNLIVDTGNKIWVTDFGLAKIVDKDVTATDGVVGTLRYMSPERFSGWSDPRSDVYSLGVTLYELATLKPAFRAADRTGLIAKIVSGRLAEPKELVPAIPTDLETIILKASQSEPGQRYQSAASMRDDLRRFTNGEPIQAKRATNWEQLRSWAKRNPILAASIAIIGMLMLAISIGSTAAAFQFNDLATELEHETIKANREAGKASRSLLLAWESEAHSRTTSQRPGHRLDALKAIRYAVDLLPSVEHNQDNILRLRNETIAALALTDIELECEFPVGNSYYFWHPSPDFKVYAGSDLNGRFECCDAQTGEQKWSFQFKPLGKAAPVLPIFSPDSKYVFGQSDLVDKCRLFDCETGQLLLELKTGTLGATDAVAFSPGVRWMAVAGSRDPIRIYDLLDLKHEPRLVEVPFKITSVFFRKRGSALQGYDWFQNEIFSYDLNQCISQTTDTKLKRLCRWLPINENRLMLGEATGHARLVEWPNMENTVYELPSQRRSIAHLEANEKASLLFCQAFARAYQLIDLATGNKILEGWGRWPKFSADGSRFSTTVDNKIQFYKIHSSRDIVETGLDHHWVEFEMHSLRFDHSGKILVACSGRETQIWDATTLRKVAAKKEKIQNGGASFTADGCVLTVTNYKLTRYNIERNGDSIRFGEPEYLGSSGGGRRAISTSNKSNTVAWRTPKHSIKIARLNYIQDAVEIIPRRTSFTPFFELHPNGNVLAVADGTIRLFDTRTGDLIHDFGEDSAGHVRTYFQFSPNGRQMICSNLFEQLLFNLENKQLVKRFKTECNLGGTDWSPDGTILALAMDQETIVLRNAQSFEELARLRLPRPMGIGTVRFNPDGNSIIAQVNENQIFRWDLISIRNELRELELDWQDPIFH